MSQADFFFHKLEETNIGLCKEHLRNGILIVLSFSMLSCSVLRKTESAGGIVVSLVKCCTWLAYSAQQGKRDGSMIIVCKVSFCIDSSMH